MTNKKLWGGRFEASTDDTLEALSASVEFDQRLAMQDIDGSIAHVTMLASTAIITQAESLEIQQGLEKIRQEIISDQFQWRNDLEDVHMNIESRLIDLIGDTGKKLHTARSRNDQVATDIRLYVKQSISDISTLIRRLQHHLVDLAERHADVIMPGFTHLQSAQPVTFGHHMLAWFEMLERDHQRFMDAYKRVDCCPLGSAALAGTTFPIDRAQSAKLLGFSTVSENSLDAVSDRDFAIETNFCIALLMTHFSRFAEELILWSSSRFSFVDLGDKFTTGSSIMPQKKNPDVAELLRGKSARAQANLSSLLILMKGQPLAYNRDNQEDKEPLFDSIDTAVLSLNVLNAMMPQIKVFEKNMYQAADEGYATATDLADYLVVKGIPFRSAHEIVGKTVHYAIENKLELSAIPLQTYQQFCPQIQQDVYNVLTLEGSVNARDHIGGTAPKQVRLAIERARQRIKS